MPSFTGDCNHASFLHKHNTHISFCYHTRENITVLVITCNPVRARSQPYCDLTSINSVSDSMTTTTPSLPQKGKYHGPLRAADYIPRPPNSFILYRSDFVKKGLIPSTVESKQQTLSVLASKCWKHLSPEEKGVWADLAAKMKHEHSLRYPAFTYKPSPKRHIKPRRQSRTRQQQIAAAEELMEQYLPVPHSRVSITTEARGRGTSTKPRQAPPQSPPQSSRDSVARNVPSSQDEPVFMEPLNPPSSIVHTTSWDWPAVNQVRQPSTSTTDHTESAMVDHSSISSQQKWRFEILSNSQVQSPENVIDVSGSSLDVVEPVQGQYDSTLRSEILPTVGLVPYLEKKCRSP